MTSSSSRIRKSRPAGAVAAALVVLGGCSNAADPAADARGSGSLTADVSTPSPTSAVTELGFLTRHADQAPRVAVEIPDGFVSGAEDGERTDVGLGWYVVSEDRQEFLGFYEMTQVYRDACHPDEDDRVTPGDSSRALAAALVEQSSSRTSEPRSTTIAGHRGVYLEVHGPTELGGCTKPALAPTRGIFVPGQLDRLWIIQVGGQRLVVDASHSATASAAADVDLLTDMVTSLELSGT